MSSFPLGIGMVSSSRGLPTKTMYPGGALGIARQIAPGEALASPTLELTDFANGSDIVILRTSTGAELAFANQANAPWSAPIDWFGAGQSAITIILIKQGYKHYSVDFNLPRAGASLPIAQQLDRAYST